MVSRICEGQRQSNLKSESGIEETKRDDGKQDKFIKKASQGRVTILGRWKDLLSLNDGR